MMKIFSNFSRGIRFIRSIVFLIIGIAFLTKMINFPTSFGGQIASTFNPMAILEQFKGITAEATQDTSTSKIDKSKYQSVKVIAHVDGDTIKVKMPNGKIEVVRFIGVNTPETVAKDRPVEYFGKEASDFTKTYLLGKTVYLSKDVSDRDKFGRLLRFVWVELPIDEKSEKEISVKMANSILIRQGFGKVMTIKPDTKYASFFTKCEKFAKENNKGMWNKDRSKTVILDTENKSTNVFTKVTEFLGF